MKLSPNQEAPTFITKDIYNNEFNLKHYRGKKLLLSFFRNVACPFCNLRVHQLKKLAADFQRNGLSMAFFFESSQKHILLSSLHSSLSPIIILSDSKKDFYKLYQVESSAMKVMSSMFKPNFMKNMNESKSLGLDKFEDDKSMSSVIPADFLIDETGVIRFLHYGTAINDHMPIELIKKFVDSNEYQSYLN